MRDPVHHDDLRCLSDLVQDAVLAAPCAKQTGEIAAERSSYSKRVLREGPVEELHHCRNDACGKAIHPAHGS